jgi:hypothetical protein
MRSMTLLMAGGAFFFSGNTLVIIVLAQQRHASSFLIGCIFACGGIGSIIGASLAPFFKKRLRVGQAALVTRWIIALLWPLYALVPLPWMMGLVDFGIGFSDPIEDVAYFSYRLQLIPDELRERVQAFSGPFTSIRTVHHRSTFANAWGCTHPADLVACLVADRADYHRQSVYSPGRAQLPAISGVINKKRYL